jgi:hypothetical protein
MAPDCGQLDVAVSWTVNLEAAAWSARRKMLTKYYIPGCTYYHSMKCTRYIDRYIYGTGANRLRVEHGI